MAAEHDGDEVTEPVRMDADTTRFELPKVMCATTEFHTMHAHRITAELEKFGSRGLSLGTPVWCAGLYPIAQCAEPGLHDGHYWNNTVRLDKVGFEHFWCNGIQIKDTHEHARAISQDQVMRAMGDWPEMVSDRLGYPRSVGDEAWAHMQSLEALASSQKLPNLKDLNVPKSEDGIFGINDDSGRSLVEFRIRDGKVEAKYYPSDLYDGAKLFVEYLKMLVLDEDGGS